MAAAKFIDIAPLGADRLARMFAEAPEMAREELLRAMWAAVQHLEAEVKERTPTAHGTLRASVFGEARIEPDGVLGVVGSPLLHAPYVELGTKPHWPPVDALVDWVRVKFGVSEETELRRVAFLVARKISVSGTPAAGMFHSAAVANDQQIERPFELAAERLAARMGEAGGAA